MNIVRKRLFDLEFSAVTQTEAVQTILIWARENNSSQPKIVVTPNLNITVLQRKNPAFRDILNSASLCLVDGRPIYWASRLFKKNLPEVVTGSDLVPAIFSAYKATPRQPVKLQVILAEEENPRPGVNPISWLLLTSLDIRSFESAITCVRWYSYRWLIERYHFVLKSGCGLEKLQLETGRRIEMALATYSIVAWRLLWLTYQARLHGEESCESFLEEHEWQSLCATIHKKSPPPEKPPSFREAVRMIASLGGFLGRKGDGEPGVKTIWLVYHSKNRPTTVNRGSMDFYTEPNIKTSDNLDYKNNQWDKGHLAPAASFSDNMENLKQTFSYLNCALQNQDLNRGEWRLLEEQERVWDDNENLVIKIDLIFDEKSQKLVTGATVPTFLVKHINFTKSNSWKCYKFENVKPLKKWAEHQVNCKH